MTFDEGRVDELERQVERRSKIVQHPSAEISPVSTCAETLGIAQSGQMRQCCIMWVDEDGNYHLGWSKMSNQDLAAYGVILTHVAGSRLVEFE